VKSLELRPIAANDANAIIKVLHYSGKVVRNSQVHFGVFLDGKCGGAIQFGPSLDKGKIQGLVRDTKWNEFTELNRFALANWMPRNSESRAISIAMKLMKRRYPFLKWVVSFANATLCGSGTIYKAAGFTLTGIFSSQNLARFPDGSLMHKMTLESAPTKPRKELKWKSYFEVTGNKYDFEKYVAYRGGELIPGFQLRYIYFLEPEYRNKLTVPIVPYSEIEVFGAGMYLGKPIGPKRN